ncbi:MAG TPA: hypothetical protein VLI54_04385 [Bacillota bacterium]|nr:hypothetical protein [Bacillota bacterium]
MPPAVPGVEHGGGGLLPHRALVEDVLQTPLFPAGSYEIAADSDRPDIRVIVHDMMSGAVQRVLDRPAHPEVLSQPLSDDERCRVHEKLGDTILYASRRIIVANNVADSLAQPAFLPPGADPPHTPRSLLQSEIGRRVYDFDQRPHPLKLPELAGDDELAPLRSGLLVVATPAAGKTVPLADSALRAGVGKPFSEQDQQKMGLLIVVPTIDIANEYLDPDGIMRQWLKGCDVGEFSHRRREISGIVDVVINASVRKGLASKAFRLINYGRRAVDEGHHARARNLASQLGQLSVGGLMLLTATPREMKRVFVDFTAATPRVAAQEGITRPVRLQTLLYDEGEGAAELAMATAAAKIIEAGKQVGIYCQSVAGKPGAHKAKEVARLVNAMKLNLPKGSKLKPGHYLEVIAGVMGDKKNERALTQYRAGDLGGFVAVSKLREGSNIHMDGLIVEPGLSQDFLDQTVGRGPRPLWNSPDPYSVCLVVEVQPRNPKSSYTHRASIWSTYEFENRDILDPGHYIGPPQTEDEGTEWLPAYVAEGTYAGRTQTHPEDDYPPAGNRDRPDRAPSQDWIDTFLASADLDAYRLRPNTPLREVTIAPEGWARDEQPVEGSELLATLAERFGVPELWLRRTLDRLQKRDDLQTADGQPLTIQYMAQRTTKKGEEGTYIEYDRWYGPDTVKYLEQNPPMQLAADTVMDVPEIAELAGTAEWHIEEIMERLGLKHAELLDRKVHRRARHLEGPEIIRILLEIESIPVAAPTAVTIADLCKELDEGFVNNRIRTKRWAVQVEMCRRNPEHGIVGFARHISAADAAAIREAYRNPKMPTRAQISVPYIGTLSGVNLSTVWNRIDNMSDAERPDIELLKQGHKGRIVSHMERRQGLLIVESLRQVKLPPHRLTLRMVQTYLHTGEAGIKTRAEELGRSGLIPLEVATPVSMNINYPGRGIATWEWSIIPALQQHAGLEVRPGVEPIDFSKVAHSQYDLNWEYSQEAQKRLLSPVDHSKLATLPLRDALVPMEAIPPDTELVLLDDYVATREVWKDDLVAALATGKVPGATLYVDDPSSHRPTFGVAAGSIEALDRHFSQTADTMVPMPPPDRYVPALSPDSVVVEVELAAPAAPGVQKRRGRKPLDTKIITKPPNTEDMLLASEVAVVIGAPTAKVMELLEDAGMIDVTTDSQLPGPVAEVVARSLMGDAGKQKLDEYIKSEKGVQFTVFEVAGIVDASERDVQRRLARYGFTDITPETVMRQAIAMEIGRSLRGDDGERCLERYLIKQAQQ